MVRVLAHAHIRHHDELGHGVLQDADRLLDDPVLGVALAPVRVLRLGYPEEEDRLDPEGEECARLVGEHAHGQLLDAGHGRDRRPLATPLDDEERVHEVVRRERRLTHEVAERARPPPASRPRRTRAERRSDAACVEIRHYVSWKWDTRA